MVRVFALPSYDADVVPAAPSLPLPADALAHLDALYRLARHLSGSDAGAEDLVQATYARALGKGAQFTAGTNLRAWLFRILRNLYLDDWRRTRASPERERLDGDDPPEPAGVREPIRGDDELERIRGVVAGDIDAALGRLGEDARTAVLLELEGFTYEELAEVLGCEVGTVKSRLSRARARLRELLADYAR